VLDDMLLKNAQRILDDDRMCFAMSVPYFISNDHLNNAQMQEINETYGGVDRDVALAQFDEIYQYCARSFRIYLVPSSPDCRIRVMCRILALFSTVAWKSRHWSFYRGSAPKGASERNLSASRSFNTLDIGRCVHLTSSKARPISRVLPRRSMSAPSVCGRRLRP
jgi:hypothetical protein